MLILPKNWLGRPECNQLGGISWFGGLTRIPLQGRISGIYKVGLPDKRLIEFILNSSDPNMKASVKIEIVDYKNVCPD